MPIDGKHAALLMEFIERIFVIVVTPGKFGVDRVGRMHRVYTKTGLCKRSCRALLHTSFSSLTWQSIKISFRLRMVTLHSSVAPICKASTPFSFASARTRSGFAVETRMRDGPS